MFRVTSLNIGGTPDGPSRNVTRPPMSHAASDERPFPRRLGGVIFVGVGLAVAALAATGLSHVAIGLSVAIVAAAAIILRPEFVAFIAAFVIFTNTSFVLGESIGFTSTTELLILLLLATFLLDRLNGRASGKGLAMTGLVLVGYVSTLALSAFSAIHPDLTLSGSIGVARNAVLVLAFIAIVTDMNRMAWAFAGMIAAVCFLAGLTVFQAIFGLQHISFLGYASATIAHIAGELDSWRITGPVTDPNYYGMILLTGLPLVAERVVSASTLLLRILAALAVAIILTAIILTYSRGALLALMLVVVLAFGNSRAFFFGMATIGVLIWASLMLLSEPLSLGMMERLTTGLLDAYAAITGQGHFQDAAVAGRLAAMIAALIHFLENPVFGIGYDQYETLYQDTAQIHGLMARGDDRQAHSLFLEILAERGLAGAIVYAGLIFYAVLAIIRGRRRLLAAGMTGPARQGRALILCFVAFYAASLFLHEAFAGYFWLLFALAIAFRQSVPDPFPSKSIKPRAKTAHDL